MLTQERERETDQSAQVKIETEAEALAEACAWNSADGEKSGGSVCLTLDR